MNLSHLESIENVQREVVLELFALRILGLSSNSTEEEIARRTHGWLEASHARKDKKRAGAARISQEEFIIRVEYWGRLGMMRVDKSAHQLGLEAIDKAENRREAFALFLTGSETSEWVLASHRQVDRLCGRIRRLMSPQTEAGREFRTLTYEAAATLHTLVDVLRVDERAAAQKVVRELCNPHD